MLDSILSSVSSTDTITLSSFLLCTAASLAFGLVIAIVFMYKNKYTKSFVVTLVILPLIVQMVIMMVGGNIGTGIAVAGAFSLIRFRSVPGSAREIGSIFVSMATGLATGTGYLVIALLFVLLVCAMNLILNLTGFGTNNMKMRELKITIPENLDYTTLFDDLFEKYTNSRELVQVRTTNMGSLYQLHYHVTLKDPTEEKNFIDDLRCRNGNLNIICGKVATPAADVL
jgi:uncharacterized membrane protein YhiD involved in acid resistance